MWMIQKIVVRRSIFCLVINKNINLKFGWCLKTLSADVHKILATMRTVLISLIHFLRFLEYFFIFISKER